MACSPADLLAEIAPIQSVPSARQTNVATILLLNGDFDRIAPALMIASSAAAMGFEVAVFFSFWALLPLKIRNEFKNKSVIEKLLTLFMPSGFSRLRTSRMNMLGVGPALFSYLMKRKRVESPAELLETCVGLGVKIFACSMSMEVMAVSLEELPKGVEVCGLAGYVERAGRSSLSLVL